MRKDRMVRWCGAGLQLCLMVLWVGHAVAGDAGGGVQAVLEVALTEVDRSEGAQAFIASDDTGSELLVLESTGSTVRRLTDSLEWWGKPLVLRDSGGAGAVLQGFHFDQRGGVFGVASSSGVKLFKGDGTQLCSNDDLRPALDIAGLRSNVWAVSLIRAGGRERVELGLSVEDGLPRIVMVDQSCRVVGGGLATEESATMSASAAAGRVLHLAADERWVYAAEAANYRVYQLDRKLEARAVLADPSLILEDGRSAGKGEEDAALVASRAAEHERERREARVPADPSRPPADPAEARPTTVTLHWVPVVSDVEWDPVERALLVLLSDQASGEVGVLDRVDPSTGEVERFPLALCDGCPAPTRPLSRLAVTKGHVWLSTALAGGPVYRVDRIELENGQRLQLVDEMAPAPPPDEPEGDVDTGEPEPQET